MLQFRSNLGNLEADYRQQMLKADAYQASMLVFITLFSIPLYIYSDYWFFGLQAQFWILLLIRGLSMGFCLVTVVLLRRVNSPSVIDRLVFSWAVWVTLTTLYVNQTRPADYFQYILLDTASVLILYLILPTTLIFRMIPALILSGGDVWMFLFLKAGLIPPAIVATVFSFLVVNVIGLWASAHLNAFRRQQYKAQVDERLLKEGMEQLATTDSLTGVLNRRRFIELVEVELHRFQRYGNPFVLLYVDLDHFKKVNDRYGHMSGDKVLESFGNLLKMQKRSIDLVGRLGGEEFGILLPETDLEGALEFGERLRQNCNAMVVETGRGNLKVTVSIGATEVSSGDLSFTDLFHRVDRGLYRAKRKGRNRIEAV